ncbi:MAG TPA: pilus assembly protein PilM [Candidatus Magasanikbacteria bacterium]|nr:pilus assembly protein PilM [Candidatus Magasanikbacteria bacterium]
MGLLSKQESFIGVDIGAHGIKLVELKKNKTRPQLWTYGILDKELDVHIPQATLNSAYKKAPMPGPMDQKSSALAPESVRDFILNESRIGVYADLLKALVKEARVEGKRVTSSLPVSYVFHAVLNLPNIEEKELPRIVEAEISKMISREASEMQIVYQKVPAKEGSKKNYTTLLVTAAPKALVAFYTAIFDKAGLELQELETEAFALARSLVGKDAAVSMIVDIGAERTNFFIIEDGLPMTHRSLHLGGNTIDEILAEHLGVDRTLVGQIKKDVSSVGGKIPYDSFMPFLDPLAKEIQYSFDLYLQQSGNEGKIPEKIILSGGGALFAPISTYLSETFPMKVFVGDPWARVIYQSGLKPVLRDIGSRMAVSIGLALRHF